MKESVSDKTTTSLFDSSAVSADALGGSDNVGQLDHDEGVMNIRRKQRYELTREICVGDIEGTLALP